MDTTALPTILDNMAARLHAKRRTLRMMVADNFLPNQQIRLRHEIEELTACLEMALHAAGVEAWEYRDGRVVEVEPDPVEALAEVLASPGGLRGLLGD